MKISIVIPARNEEENVKPLISEIMAGLDVAADFEIVYVDDGSTDATRAELSLLVNAGNTRLRPVRHRFSVGQSTAIMTGLHAARGDLVVTMDADGQNDPADISAMLERAGEFPPGVDFCIAGFRKNRKDTAWKRFQSRVANGVRQTILDDGTPDTGCGLKILPKSTFLKLPYFDHMHRFIPALVRRINGQVVVVEVNHRDRRAGTSKYRMLDRLGVGIVDLFGVMWLKRRVKIPELVDD